MNCFDCAVDHPTAGPEAAVAVCAHCGAGVCVRHAWVIADHFTTVVPLNRRVAIEPAARLVLCPTCHAGHAALHTGTAAHTTDGPARR